MMAPWKNFTMPPPSPSRHNLVDVVKLPSPGAVILAEVQRLLAEGADVNQTNGDGQTALLWVSNMNDGVAIATVLIEAGADVNKADNWSHTPMYYACLHGLVTMTQLLSSHGASRNLTIKIPGIKRTLEETAMQTGNSALAAWLASSSKWTTPLHHLDIIPTRRAHALLCKGATVLAAAMPGDPTPLSLARELHAKGKAAQGSAAALVLGWWQLRRLALAMGTHKRLGAESPLRHLDGHQDLLEMIAEMSG